MKKIVLVFLFIIFVLAIAYFFVFRKGIKFSGVNLPQNEIGEIIKKIGKEFKNKYKNNEISYSDKLGLWWISPEGLDIINPNSSGVSLSLSCAPGEALPEKDLVILVPIVDKIFMENNYKVNSLNSSISFKDDKFYNYVKAYEKEEIKCVLTATPDCPSGDPEKEPHNYLSVVCTDSYEKNYQEQVSLLRDLNIKDAVINVSKIKDDFVYLNINLRRTGYYMIAKKENGKWKEIFSGQDYPQCSLMEKYKVPKEIYLDCY